MALREVNLIPAEFLSRRQVTRHLLFWSGCLLVVLGLVGGFYFYQSQAVLSIKGSMLTLNDMQTHLGMRIEEINRIKDELERLDQQQAALEGIARNHPYSKILFKLADMMNPDTWLTQLAIDSSKEKDGKIGLVLTGLSFSNAELGNFVDRFSNDLLLKQVDALMKSRNVEMITIEPLVGVEEKLYTRIPIRMIFNGAFADVYGTLLDLENMNRILVMDKINISKTANEPLCRVDLTASVF
jgi:Tfp pilus assembly protein PilN